VPAVRSSRRSGGTDDPLLCVFWYPLDSADLDDPSARRGHLGAELVGAAQRLDMALAELREAAQVRDLWRSIERVEFRLENFAGRLCELRERLLGLRAEAEIAAAVERILALIDDDLPVRDLAACRTFLHLSVRAAGGLRDPRHAAARLRRRPDERRRVNRRLRQELGDTVTRYAERVARIIELVVAVLDQTAGGSRWQ
jgi:hypothetical protein